MKQLILTAFILCSTAFVVQSFAQEQILPEVIVVARSYKYLKAVNNKESAQPVKVIEWKAAAYDVKNSEYYEDDYDNYFITFFLPQGYILAAYDSAGRLLRTAERFNNVDLPSAVKNAVAQRFPHWSVSNDTYIVSYESGVAAKKIYKLILHNGSKRLRVKINDKGEFQD